MNDHRSLFENLRKRPGMYVQNPTYSAISALVLGYDLACEGGVLRGFREWLIVRLNTGNNLGWPALVLNANFPDAANPDPVAIQLNSFAEKQAIDTLFQLIEEFDVVRSAPDGMRRIYAEYERWLRKQDWYNPRSPGWIE